MDSHGQSPRHLDHFVFVPEDMDEAAKTYEKLGFQVLPKMRHLKFGSCNRVIQLGDNYLEFLGDIHLINDAEHLEFYGRRRSLGSGMSNFSFSSDALAPDQARLADLGLRSKPINSASRPVLMPDGRQEATDSNFFYTVFEAAPYQTPFFSEHLKPETIFIPAYQEHPNTAQSVTGVICASLDPARDAAHLAMLAGGEAREVEPDVFQIALGRGHRTTVYSQSALDKHYGTSAHFNPDTGGCAVGLEINVSDLNAINTIVEKTGIEAEKTGGRIKVPAHEAGGVLFIFYLGL